MISVSPDFRFGVDMCLAAQCSHMNFGNCLYRLNQLGPSFSTVSSSARSRFVLNMATNIFVDLQQKRCGSIFTSEQITKRNKTYQRQMERRFVRIILSTLEASADYLKIF